MEDLNITFDENGFTLEGKRIQWGSKISDMVDLYSPIEQLFLNLDAAQKKWESIHRLNLDYFVGEGEMLLQLLEAKTDQERIRIRLGRQCSKSLQDINTVILKEMLSCMANSNENDEMGNDFASRIASNPDIVHFLSVLGSKSIHLSLITLEYLDDVAPMLIEPVSQITDQHLYGQDWMADPFKMPLKVRFERSVGKLVSINM